MIVETNQLAASRLFRYNADGWLVGKTDRNGRVTQYVYDNLGRETAEKWMSGASVLRTFSFVYDAAGESTSAADPDAGYTYGYDNLGRTTGVIATIAGLTPTVTLGQGFYANGQRSGLDVTIGSTNDMVVDYLYDNLGRTTRVTEQALGGGNAVAPKRADFAYDAASQPTTLTRYANPAGTQLGEAGVGSITCPDRESARRACRRLTARRWPNPRR